MLSDQQNGQVPALQPEQTQNSINDLVDDDDSVQWLESDEEVDVATEEVTAPVLPSTRPKRKRVSTPESESSDGDEDEEEIGGEAGDEDASDTSSEYKPAPRTKRQKVSGPVTQPTSASAMPTNSLAAPSRPTGGKSAAVLSAFLEKEKGRSHTPWNPGEDKMAEDIMREIIDNGKGDGRFVEISERMTEAGYKRSYTAVKNQWNRRLREATGLDERRKKKGPLATSKQDKATKEARKQRKLVREAEEERLKEEQGEDPDEPGEQDAEEETEAEEFRDDTGADDPHEGDTEGEDASEEHHEEYEIRRDACVCMGRIDDHMVECHNQDGCRGARWYHLWCAGFTVGPAGPWICAFCEMD